MLLDTVNKSLQILLGGAPATNQLPFTAVWADHTTTTFVPASGDGVSNGATPVTLVAAPAASVQRQVKDLTVYNADTAPVTLTLRLNNNGTFRVLCTVVLAVADTLCYQDARGLFVLDGFGQIKTAIRVDPSIAGGEGALNGSTWVSIVGSPAAGISRTIKKVRLHNRDTAVRTLKIRKVKGGSSYVLDVIAGLAVDATWEPITTLIPIVLDATDESLEAQSDAAAATTEPAWDVVFEDTL